MSALLLAFGVLISLVASSTVGAAGPYDLQVSKSSDRSAPVVLNGTTQSGNIYVFTSQSSTTDITRVDFYLDNPAATGTPRKSEANPPYDFNGGSVTLATAFNTTTIPDGSHSITAKIVHTNATSVLVTSNFTVQNNAPPTPKLTFSPTSLTFAGTAGGSPPANQSSTLATSDTLPANFTITDNASWLTETPPSGTGTSTSISFTADPTSESPGTKIATVTATAPGYDPATLTVTFNVSPAAGGGCQLAGGVQLSPLSCDQVLVTMPYNLDFSSDAGKIVDKNGVGTGFTMVLPSTNGTGYLPANLTVNTATPGTLDIQTTAGLLNGAAGSATAGDNAQDNALGVGIKPGKAVLMKTTIHNVPLGTGALEQAGLYFGNDENNYVKLIVRSSLNGTTVENKIQLLMEVNGVQSGPAITGALSLEGADVVLSLNADPVTQLVTGTYAINEAAPVTIGSVTAPPAFFTNDAAGVDPTIGTNTFGGVFASHRNATSSLTYSFDSFSLEDVTAPPPPPPGNFNFNRVAVGGTFTTGPTAMTFGPDGKLYVTELLGRIHKMTLNASHQVTNDQVITTLGSRLTLGIAIDPASTASNVIVWVAHSDPDLAGPDSTTGLGGASANSGVISKLTGASLGTKADIITGLPRSRANHSTNEIHFGPDGKLYIAQAGNTGAGAPNSTPASLGEFGWREEQPLSAAILVADVNAAAGFDGTCDNAGVLSYSFHGEAIYGANPCDVHPYATGFRNAYDLVWHSNGSMYAPNNGESVGPTYPKVTSPNTTTNCPGEAPTTNNPGTQDDFLMRVVQNKYYGHPNPHRIEPNGPECIYKDGSKQGVAADPDYTVPVADVGAKASADGIIEYTGNAFGGALTGNLLITRYSQQDDILRVCLSADGTTVTSTAPLLTGFNDPLPIVQGSDGTIYVGEFGATKLTALVPTTGSGACTGGGGGGGIGTWTSKTPMPVAYLDPGGAELGGKLYVVAGKTKNPTTGASVHQRTLYVYDPTANSWTKKANLPTAYPAVENPAVVGYNGKLYVFGGGSSAFSGAKTSAAAYNPTTNTWSMLAAMPVARAGAVAEEIGTGTAARIYVAGGLSTTGASLATMSIYNPNTNTWASGASMGTARDNPGGAALGGKLYVFGGRTRLASGTTVNGTLATGQAYNPATNTWSNIASMPTGRRSMVVGLLHGKAQVIGGERTSTGLTFAQNEEYDPATNTWRALKPMTQGRHGAAAATINGIVYVAAGGTKGGSFYSTLNEAFTY